MTSLLEAWKEQNQLLAVQHKQEVEAAYSRLLAAFVRSQGGKIVVPRIHLVESDNGFLWVTEEGDDLVYRWEAE